MTDTAQIEPDGRESLSFEDDKGAGRSTWIAAILLVAIVGWMLSGLIIPSADADEMAAQVDAAPVAVATRVSSAEAVTLYFQAEGQALPDRDTTLRAGTSGDVAEVLVSKGDDVSEGQVIARLSSDRLDADLRKAQQDLSRIQQDFDTEASLFDRGLRTASQMSQSTAALNGAQAALVAAQTALEGVDILAPFAGRVETLSLDEGEFVSAGADVGRIVDLKPLTVALQVPQQALNRLDTGQTATVSFITGETRDGVVSFVGTSAASETRTFLSEVEVANHDGDIPAGISAEISIPTGETKAHFISPSIVSLSPDGEIGVKTVTDNMVAFVPIQIVRAEIDGIWVTGLPDEVQVITVGQGFVRDGEIVAPSPEAQQ